MNTKMKVLSLALIGAFGYVGAASAACPSSPVPPWSSVSAFQGSATIANGGYAGTECRLDSTINVGAGGGAIAAVSWSGTPEPRYRAQFIIKADSLANQAISEVATVFNGASVANGDAVRFTLYGNGSGGHNLAYVVRYDDASGHRYKNGFVPVPKGETHVEFDLQTGAAGSFSLWIENNDPLNPNASVTGFDNSEVEGVDLVYLGLAAPSTQFVTKFAGTAVGFDQFDSRRENFIGF